MNVLDFIYKHKETPVASVQSDIPTLNSWLKGGLRPGQIVEWGIRPGTHCRPLLLSFLRGSAGFQLWSYNPENRKVYAPSWASYGIDLNKVFFIGSPKPIKDLRPLFLDTTFSFIILDQPQFLSQGDWAFLQIQARINGQVIFVIQPYFLNSLKGNPYAAYRINIKKNFFSTKYSLQGVKGTLSQNLLLSPKDTLNNQRQNSSPNKTTPKGVSL